MTWARRILLLSCFAPAVVLTVLRLAQPEMGIAVRLVSFAPLAVVLYFITFLLSLGKVFFPGPGKWHVHAAVTAVALAGLGLHGWWLSPQFLGTHPSAAEDAQPVRVLTVNLYRGAADGPSVVEQAVLGEVDVLVLEEVTPGVLSQMQEAGLEQAFPYQAGSAEQGVAGTMVFATGEITDVSRLSTQFDSWSMTIGLAQGDQRVFAVHPQPPTGSAKVWRKDLAAVAAAARDQDPDLVAGDFNATADHASFRAVLDAGLSDAAERANAGWRPTWPANGEVQVLGIPLPRLVQIDHVLIGPKLTALRVQTVAIEGTDHAGVLAEVALR